MVRVGSHVIRSSEMFAEVASPGSTAVPDAQVGSFGQVASHGQASIGASGCPFAARHPPLQLGTRVLFSYLRCVSAVAFGCPIQRAVFCEARSQLLPSLLGTIKGLEPTLVEQCV